MSEIESADAFAERVCELAYLSENQRLVIFNEVRSAWEKRESFARERDAAVRRESKERIAQLERERERDEAIAERKQAIEALHEMRMSFIRLAEHHKRDHHRGDMPPDHDVENGYFTGSAVLAKLRDVPMIRSLTEQRDAWEQRARELLGQRDEARDRSNEILAELEHVGSEASICAALNEAIASDLARKAAEAQMAELRAALDDIMDYRGGADNPLEDEYVVARADAALARTPTEALARHLAVARVVEVAIEIEESLTDDFRDEVVAARKDGSTMLGWVELSRTDMQRLSDALAALDGGAGDERARDERARDERWGMRDGGWGMRDGG